MEIPKFNISDYSKLISKTQMPPPQMEWENGVMVEVVEKTSVSFLEEVYSNPSPLTLGSSSQITRVTGNIEFDLKKYNRNSLTLMNFEFTGVVSLSGDHEMKFNLGEKIILKDCKFLKPLIFNNCISDDTKPKDFSQKSGAIEIINGSYILLRISKCIFPFGIDIYAEEGEKLEIDWFESLSNHFPKAGYNFENVIFKSKLDITGDTIENIGVDFRNCISKCQTRISSVNSPSIAFVGTDSIFEKDIRIWSGNLNGLIWNYGEFYGEIDITAVKLEKYFSIIGSIFNDKFLFKRKDNGEQVRNMTLPEEIWIQDSQFKNGIEFQGDNFKTNKLSIRFSEKSSGVIDFRNTFFKEVTLKGNNFNNSLFLRDCSYDKLILTHLFNKSLISFNNNNPELNDGVPEEFLIQNSNLGNTEFYDFDFLIYPVVRIIDSRFDNIFVNGVEWFEPQNLEVDEKEQNNTKALSQKREIYRQLKLAAEKQSDRITALLFKGREIQVHDKYLRSKRKINLIATEKQSFINRIKKVKLASIISRFSNYIKYQSDKISILLGETNDHGQNWIKPLFSITLISTGIFPLLFIMADPEINFWPDFSFDGWNFFWAKVSEHGSLWPQLFNPTRRVSYLFETIEHPFWVYFLDGLQRIVLAFFIFQIVSAFRKFVK
ncbi:hypothetical protein [Negadavirga shengliensis]|uniref:Uncharacterized protein n=1 Tax=Negadavirga shengliensis TaxID=1389218 RepID=A0ABV9SZU8_9BACT